MNQNPGGERQVSSPGNNVELDLAEIKGQLIAINSTLGRPAVVTPPQFEGDPPKVQQATGLCLTVARLATSDARRHRASIVSASGLAIVVTALVQLLAAWRGNAPPAPAMSPAIHLDGMTPASK